MEDLTVEHLLAVLEEDLKRVIAQRHITQPLLIGIHNGGVWIAERLRERLGITEPLATLNISFYRDDFSQIGLHPQVKPSRLPASVEGRDILLIDDVLYTGRTIRAALNEIFDYGRPAQVVLGVLVERDGRQLPIQADAVGARIELAPGQRIKLSGPDPLSFSMHQTL